MKRRQLSFFWLSLAVMLPLLVLAVLALLGLKAQDSLAKATVRNIAEASAEQLVFHVSNDLEQRFRPVPAFPDLPPAGPPAVENDPLDQNDVSQLLPVRAKDDGLSPAGLPRRVIAAMRVFEITRKRSDAEQAIRLATTTAPSVLTLVVLQRIHSSLPALAGKALREWQLVEQARSALINHDIGPRGEWYGSLLIEKSPDGMRFLHRDDLIAALDQAKRKTNPAAAYDIRVSIAGTVIHGPSPVTQTGEKNARSAFYHFNDHPLATASLPFGEGAQLDLLANETTPYEALLRTQTRWTLGLLILAVAGAATGLWIIRRVYERERRLNALKSDFVASVSHELRAPIASIRLMADALEEGKIEAETSGEFHRLISREGARLSTLIENVLDFARIEQGRKEWRLEESDLRALVVDTAALMEPLAAEKDIRLMMENLPAMAIAMIDADAIRQALVNLLDNAIKFSPPGSEVKIQLFQGTGTKQWEMRITDQGPGIPPKEHARIFEKFHRLGGELRRETQGTGIGLSLVKAIAEANRGHIHLISEPGMGSTFILTLPMA